MKGVALSRYFPAMKEEWKRKYGGEKYASKNNNPPKRCLRFGGYVYEIWRREYQ